MTTNDLPLVGAALGLQELRLHREWILAGQRDLELQHFVKAEVLVGDWQGDRVRWSSTFAAAAYHLIRLPRLLGTAP
jgi:hypothetical protein